MQTTAALVVTITVVAMHACVDPEHDQDSALVGRKLTSAGESRRARIVRPRVPSIVREAIGARRRARGARVRQP